MKNLYAAVGILFWLASTQGFVMSDGTPSQLLRSMLGKDHFVGEPSSLYTGVADPSLRIQLNTKVDAAANALASAATNGATSQELLAILQRHIAGIDRDSLDTEDAERVALLFERMLDTLGIESSDGVLNNWMYGFDPA